MGKLEKLGRSILKKLSRHPNRRRATSNVSTSSDEEPVGSRSMPDVTQFVHQFTVVPPEEDVDDFRRPASEADDSAGYATDNSALSSLSPLDVKRTSVDYSESQGYYSTAELSPIPRIVLEDEEATVILEVNALQQGTVIQTPRVTVPPSLDGLEALVTVPRISVASSQEGIVTVPRITVPAHQTVDPTVPLVTVPQERTATVPRITVPTLQEPTVTEPSHRTFDPTIPLVTVPHEATATVPRMTAHQEPTVTQPAHQSYDPTEPLLPGITVPRITVPKLQKPTVTQPAHQTIDPTVPRITVDRTPLYTKKLTNYPKINISAKSKIHPLHKSTQLLADIERNEIGKENLEIPKFSISGRSATLSNLTEDVEDPIERFLKSSIYKTKMITTVFEQKDGGIEEIYQDVIHEIDRWFETKNMMAVACELHWSVPKEKRSRQLECKLKEKLLHALRENNKRLLYLKGMGKGKTPVKLAESKTVENISRDRETDSVRGIYQRSYTRLLPYLHKETPEWHSQYWTLQELQEPKEPQNGANEHLAQPQHFLFNSEPSDVLSKNSLISLNIIGLSILGNGRKSCGSLFFDH